MMMRLVLGIGLVAAVSAGLSGCVYSFFGGGLPGHIRTVAIAPFDNDSREPQIEIELERWLRERIPRDLGVRIASEEIADAVIRGRIRSYDEPRPSVRRGDTPGDVDVVQRRVRISFEAEIYDLVEDRAIWTGRSLVGEGEYLPDVEGTREGRQKAIEDMVRLIVDGAQSDW